MCRMCPEQCGSPTGGHVHGGGTAGEVSAAGATQGVPLCDGHALLTRGAFRVAALVRMPLCARGPGRLAHL